MHWKTNPYCWIASCISLILLTIAYAQPGGQPDFPLLEGPYFGQTPPGIEPEPFVHELFAGDLHTSVVFSPDGREAYWGPMETDLMFMRMEGGRWTSPRLAPFLPERGGGEPFFSHDGRRLYFLSVQPVREAVSEYHENIWYVDRSGEGWTEPRPLCHEVNSMDIHWEFSFSERGELFFSASGDIYHTRFENERCSKPTKLGGFVNTENMETTPFIAPDESYLIFSRIDPKVSHRADLYVSFGGGTDGWSEAKLMSDLATEDNHELWPFVTYDGRYLFFIRNTGPKADLKPFWVDVQILDRYR